MLQRNHVINHHEKGSQPMLQTNPRDIQDKRQSYTDTFLIVVCVCVCVHV